MDLNWFAMLRRKIWNIVNRYRNAVVRGRAIKPVTRRVTKPKVEEPVILMVSSDEEDNANDESQVSNLLLNHSMTPD